MSTQPLWPPSEFVAYGEICTVEPIAPGTWQMQPQTPFRPTCLLFWAHTRCQVESLQIAGVEQLKAAINVQAFNGYNATTPENFLRLFKPELPKPIGGRYSIIHQRFLPEAAPLLNSSLNTQWNFPAMNVGAVASLRFSRPTRAFLLLGPALLDAPAFVPPRLTS